MAPPAPAIQDAGGGGNGRQEQPRQMLTGIIRMAVIWYFASKFFGPKRSPTDQSSVHQISNLFHKGESMDMWLYLSQEEKFNDFGSEGSLIWHETNIPYAVWSPESTRTLSLNYTTSEALKNNGSMYAHVFFARSGYSPDPSDPEYQPLAAFGRTHPIVRYLPKSKADKRKSLLGSKDATDGEEVPEVVEETEVDDGPVEWISYWKPNVTINLVDDFTRYSQNAVPPNIAPYMNLEPSTGDYFPTVFFNEFWLLRDKLIPVNETVSELPLNLEVGPISMTKWQIFQQIDQSFQIHKSYGSMGDGEGDELKRVFLEGNPILLGITMVVSLFHSVFDFLAFKNDIQFWNKNKSMEGLSAKSVVVNFFCQFIVFLYLLDNETSWMILGSSGVGCCIEFWKIGKAMHIEIDRSGRIPMLRFRDRESYAGNKTKEYDDLAMKYLTYVLFLLAAGFSVYSLMYERHKSWYSWILSSLTSCVYMFGAIPPSRNCYSFVTKPWPRFTRGLVTEWIKFLTEANSTFILLGVIIEISNVVGEHLTNVGGFIMMCPQLFINYKLKSVAHLPWRQMTYKFLNTIIDDLFAFVIKMPALHRLSVFRDDLIFVIYIYQRWIYPVDKKRVNEFGFGGEEEQQPAIAANAAENEQQTEEDKKTN